MKLKQLKKVIAENQEVEISTMDYYSTTLYVGIAKNIPQNLDSKIVGAIGSINGENAIFICVGGIK